MNINLTPEILKNYYAQGLSDSIIGSFYGMTGEGIAYRRKKYGISLQDKHNFTKEAVSQMALVGSNALAADYYSLTQEEFSNKYRVSKTIWFPFLKKKGIVLKTEHRKLSYPLLTFAQRTMILGSLLGDGGLTKNNYFYESHSKKQTQYLYKKHEILKPFSGKIYPVDENTGLRFKTVQHPVFKEFYEHFYKEDSPVKQIPVLYLKDNWHDHILAYWFMDDGYYDDVTNELIIANKAPDSQLGDFMLFLNERYGWNFNCAFCSGINRITFSKRYYFDFYSVVLEVATPDLYYKFPENRLTSDMVDLVPEFSDLKPKFYRKASKSTKKKILDRYILILMVEGFPELVLTEKRIQYLYRISETIPYGKAYSTLWEYNHPQIYEKARKKWNSRDFIKEIALVVLSECPRITGSYVRKTVRKILNVELR
jgi:hypothetical protein